MAFSNLHPACLFDKAMVRVIYSIWEVAQMYSVCQVYNGTQGHYQTGRNHLTVMDFRVSGK